MSRSKIILFISAICLVLILAGTGVWYYLLRPHWSIVSSPNPQADNHLKSVAALSSDDVWAIGYTTPGYWHTLIEHWDGSKWQNIATPNPGGANNVLNGIAALAPNNVWAVGYYENFLDAAGRNVSRQPLLLHWNGSKWSIIPGPSFIPQNGVLNGITALSAQDIWAVGALTTPANTALIEHWNGSQWSIVPAPTFTNASGSSYGLTAIAAVAANDVWAVGSGQTSSAATSVITHWNGSQWQMVAHPDLNARTDTLASITVASAQDVWAVGDSSLGNQDSTLVEHWNGSAWSIVTTPTLKATNSTLSAVTADSSTNVWIVGYTENGTSSLSSTLIEHWNGSQWSVISTPNAGSNQASNFLYGVAIVPHTSHIWAVGVYNNGTGPYQTLTLTL